MIDDINAAPDYGDEPPFACSSVAVLDGEEFACGGTPGHAGKHSYLIGWNGQGAIAVQGPRPAPGDLLSKRFFHLASEIENEWLESDGSNVAQAVRGIARRIRKALDTDSPWQEDPAPSAPGPAGRECGHAQTGHAFSDDVCAVPDCPCTGYRHGPQHAPRADADRLLDWAARLIVAAAEGADVSSGGWRTEQRDWLSAFNATPPAQPAPGLVAREADAGRAAFLDEILLNANDEPHVGEADGDFAIRYVRDLEHQAGELATLIAEGEPLTVKPADDVKPAPELAVTLAPGEEPGDNLTEDQRQRYRQWLAGQ